MRSMTDEGEAMREDTPERSVRNARVLRRRMTNAEDILWRSLRNRQFLGVKFRRQVPVGPYVADFACVTQKLIVECDGAPHENPEQRAHDARRDAWFAEQGWRVLRISNERIIGGGNLVLDDICRALQLPSSGPR
jgi:very-short-patch-repair endonuclease